MTFFSCKVGRYWTTVPFCFPTASCFPFGLQHTHVTPVEGGSVAHTFTTSVTCKTEILPSARQTATMEGTVGFHFISFTIPLASFEIL